ncbi:hypothetical protein LTR09_004511 [Extremus antarcticus]|uniref:Enoyl reductase (ER) domain-containing protein n=1 Tax=Extremus antarcticus TaxID=702011 RepID=A0AAJ0DPP5_9PEZI|nr:hypothetical protein LTR09_004511 [Extremus antarcticus]
MAVQEIPKKCKAGIVVNPGPDFHLEVVDVDVPSPGPNELLLRLNCTGLCMSDVHYMLNDLPFPKQMQEFGVYSPGHEGAGVVVAIGSQVSGWKLGDRAGVKPMWDVCHNCEQCWTGIEQWCGNKLNTGLEVAGTYQQYITSPALYTTRIPDGVPDEVAGPIMCAASTMHRALTDSGLKPGKWVVFPGGGGGVGIQGVQLAKAMGMRPIVIDSGEEKAALAKRCGAEAFIDFKKESDVAAKVVETADGVGAHGVMTPSPT